MQNQRSVSTQTDSWLSNVGLKRLDLENRRYFGQKIWSTADDEWLWNNRSLDVDDLAHLLDRSRNAIKSRLKHFNDPNHAAYRESDDVPNLTSST